jgi:hypothetical protein
MDQRLLESLLYQEESEALDFKVAQYPFEGATDEEKSELLKDILAFANAWRQTDAYILIGVEEVRGGRSIVRGVSHHLLNRNIQQFVSAKTNRPIEFFYTPLTFEGVELGVLTIPLQDRPTYLNKRYGRLEQHVVYIRRSDTTGTAAPDEVARMGSSAALTRMQPVLELAFGDLKQRTTLGTSLQIVSVILKSPADDTIPLYGPTPERLIGSMVNPMDSMRNRNYYQDLAAYLRDTALLCPVGMAVTNPSPTVAEEVIVTLRVDAVPGLIVLDEAHAPCEPSTEKFPAIPRGLRHPGRLVCVTQYGPVFEARAEIGTVQPGTTRWSADSFYLGGQQPLAVTMRISISANNLRAPTELTANIEIQTRSELVGLKDILRIAHGKG